MKIIAINSSHRTNGNTEKLIKRIEYYIKEMAARGNIDLEYEYIALADLDLHICRGCRICFDKGEDKCPLKDDLLVLRDKLLEADGIILGSPVYVEDVNSIMKNWIDRMAFNCHRPAFFEKTAIIISTSGAGSSNHTLRTMKNALTTWGFHLAGQNKFRMGALMKENEVVLNCSKGAEKLAGKLISSLEKGKQLRPTFYSLIVFIVQQKCWQKAERKKDTIDYEYWNNRGWIKLKCNYYMKQKANPIKCKSAELLGAIIAKFII